MPYLIDAYNVLYQAHTVPNAADMISAFDLAQVVGNSSIAEELIDIICDGTPKDGGELVRNAGSIQLRFAGPGADADSLIELLIAQSHAPRELIVVSNDRRIIKAAKRRKAKPMTSEDFLKLITRDRPMPQKPKESTTAKSTEEWLEVFDEIPEDAELSKELKRKLPPSPQSPATPQTPLGQSAKKSLETNTTSTDNQDADNATDDWLKTFGMEEADLDEREVELPNKLQEKMEANKDPLDDLDNYLDGFVDEKL